LLPNKYHQIPRAHMLINVYLKLNVYIACNLWNGPFRNCQLLSFITLHGQFQSNRLGLICQVTIWPRKHKRKTPSQVFTRSKQIYHISRSLKFCGTVHYPWYKHRPTVAHFCPISELGHNNGIKVKLLLSFNILWFLLKCRNAFNLLI